MAELTLHQEDVEGAFLVSQLNAIGLCSAHSTMEHRIYVYGAWNDRESCGELYGFTPREALLILAESHAIKNRKRHDYHHFTLQETRSGVWRVMQKTHHKTAHISASGTLIGAPTFTNPETARKWCQAVGVEIEQVTV